MRRNFWGLSSFILLSLAGCDNSPPKATEKSADVSSQENSTPAQSESQPVDPAEAEKLAFMQDISGVWSVAGQGTITINYDNNQLALVFNDDPKFVKLGAVDTGQQTANFLLKRSTDNKDIIWTIRRVWNNDHTSFNLVLNLDDGSQRDLGFIRKISPDDTNRLANLYAANKDADGSQTATQTLADASGPLTVKPSFDCAGANGAVEKMVCSSQDLATADAKASELYKSVLAQPGAAWALDEQRYWLKFVRDKCETVDCLNDAYNQHISDLETQATAPSVAGTFTPDEAQRIVSGFYDALGRGDGAAAAANIVPTKRAGGPLSPDALGQFASRLAGPFVVSQIIAVDHNHVNASYSYVTTSGYHCSGLGIATVVQRGGVTMIEGLQAPNRC